MLFRSGSDASNNETATIYQNDGGGTFTDISAGLTGVGAGSSSWGDVDGDGDVDLAVTGNDGSNATATIYRNDGGGTFSAIGAGLTGVDAISSSSWGDVDADGDLDLVVTGSDGSIQTATIYENTAPPAIAVEQGGTPISNGDTFDLGSTTAGTDLSTTFTVGNVGTGVDLDVSDFTFSGPDAASFTVTPTTATLAPNATANFTVTLDGATPGTFDATAEISSNDPNVPTFTLDVTGEVIPESITQVQPQSGAPGTPVRIYGSGFDGTTTATIGGTATVVDSIRAGGSVLYTSVPSGPSGTSDVTVDFGGGTTATIPSGFDVLTGGPGRFADIGANVADVSDSSTDWGDMDGDGDLDLVVTGNNTANAPQATIYENQGSGSFVPVGAGLTGVSEGSSTWGDMDGDEDLDLVVTGFDGSARSARIYENQGGGSFAPIGAGLTGVIRSSSDWGDMDGDGDLDLVVTGRDVSNNRTATVYVNQGGGSFAPGAGLTGVSTGSSDWGDVDGDGDLDLVITGEDGSGSPTATIYENQGGGSFAPLGAGLTRVELSSSDWGDFNGDGTLDLLVTGLDTGFNATTTIYQNDGSGTFSPLNLGLPGVANNASKWGDLDGDGDLDLLITGLDNGGSGTAIVYENQGSGMFAPLSTQLVGVNEGTSEGVDWGDFDSDGDLDLVLTGVADVGGTRSGRIYENVPPPTATTDPVTDIGVSRATLNATVNPTGFDARVYFELTETSTGDVSVLAGDTLRTNLTTAQPVALTTPDSLLANTSYTYIVSTANAADSVAGIAEGFTTDLAPVLSFTPAALTETLPEGGTRDVTLTLQNSGPAGSTLEYSFPNAVSMTLVEQSSIQTSRSEPGVTNTEPKGGTSLDNTGDPVLLGAGGPDTFGYNWIDSNESAGPAFSWTDITSTGTFITLGLDDSQTVPLPFSFDFYGESKTDVTIASNGYLTFGTNGTDFTNDGIPNTTSPDDLIAPFWDDLDPGSGGTVHYLDDGNRFIVQWTDVPFFNQPSTANTFQVILNQGGSVRFQYLSTEGSGSATVGIENSDASDGLEVSSNVTYVEDNLAVLLSPGGDVISNVSPASGSIAGGSQQTVTVTLGDQFLDTGTYNETLDLQTNDPGQTDVGIPVDVTVEPRRVTQVQPQSGAPGTPVRIYGNGFDGGTTLTFGGTTALIDSISGTGDVLYAQVPSGVSGTVDVLADFGGGITGTLPGAFDVLTGGPGIFSDIGASLAGVRFSSSDWGDYDGDGDLDLVITGRDGSGNETARIYRNDGGSTFTDISAGLTGV